MQRVNKKQTLKSIVLPQAEVKGSTCYFNWSHSDVFSHKYSNSKFSQNTINLLSIKVATCFD